VACVAGVAGVIGGRDVISVHRVGGVGRGGGAHRLMSRLIVVGVVMCRVVVPGVVMAAMRIGHGVLLVEVRLRYTP